MAELPRGCGITPDGCYVRGASAYEGGPSATERAFPEERPPSRLLSLLWLLLGLLGMLVYGVFTSVTSLGAMFGIAAVLEPYVPMFILGPVLGLLFAALLMGMPLILAIPATMLAELRLWWRRRNLVLEADARHIVLNGRRWRRDEVSVSMCGDRLELMCPEGLTTVDGEPDALAWFMTQLLENPYERLGSPEEQPDELRDLTRRQAE